MQNRFASFSCSCATGTTLITLHLDRTLSFDWYSYFGVPDENMLKEGLPNRQHSYICMHQYSLVTDSEHTNRYSHLHNRV